MPEAPGAFFPDPPTRATRSTGQREERAEGTRNAVWVHGIFARLANSLFLHWRSHQPKPHRKTTTDFAATMSAEHARRVIRTVTAPQPNLTAAS